MNFESIVIFVIPRFPALLDVLVALEFILNEIVVVMTTLEIGKSQPADILRGYPTIPHEILGHLCPDNTEFRAGGHDLQRRVDLCVVLRNRVAPR